MSALSGTCQCGAVKVEIQHAPEFINDCNCTLCTRCKAQWGYFHPSEVKARGLTSLYVRPDREMPAVEIHTCEICSDTTHWTLTQAYQKQKGSNDMMGVNMSLFPQDDLRGVELRFPDGKAWSGVGPYTYRRESLVMGFAK